MKPVTYKFVELVEWDADMNEKRTGVFRWAVYYSRRCLGFHFTRRAARTHKVATKKWLSIHGGRIGF